MKLINRIKGLFTNSTFRNPADWFWKSTMIGSRSDSGMVVNSDKAMTLAWVWQAVNTISNDIARLPVILYDKRNPDDRVRATTHPGYSLLKRAPNPYMSPKTLLSVLMKNALLSGNGVAWIQRDGRGAPIALYPLPPDNVTLEVVNNEPIYVVQFPYQDKSEKVALSFRDVIHIKNLTNNGYWGYDTISYARNSIGLGLATEQHGNRFFKNNARPSVVLETDGTIDKERADNLLASWNEMHAGSNNAYKTALLSGGMKAKIMSINNDNAQWLDSRKFQRQEVASWFNIPPHKLGDSSKTSFSSLEAENRSYADMTLMNWIVEIEQQLDNKLLTARQRQRDQYNFEFLTAGLLRADLITRYQSYQIGISSEFLSPNEVRKLENMPSREGGDTYQNPNTKSSNVEVEEEVEDEVVEEVEENNGLENALRKLVDDRVTRMMRIENNKVVRASQKDENFVVWMDNFYQDLQTTFVESLKPCMDTIRAAGFKSDELDNSVASYLAESCERLLDVAGTATFENFETAIVEELAEWDSRKQQLINAIIGSK
jgi:HK97 family phage portal protein